MNIKNVAFAYNAIEAPWPGMGRHFLEHRAAIADVIKRGEAVIRKRLDLSLRAILASDAPLPEGLLSPVNTVTQIALTAEWQERGVKPTALVCRCGGEFAAAYASGAVSFEDALEIPCRIALMTASGLGRGKLILVHVPCEDALALRVNCPVRYEVVSEADPFTAVVGCAAEDAVAVKTFFAKSNILVGSTSFLVAWHTWLIEEMRDEFLRPLNKPTQSARLPIYSGTARGPLPPMQDWAQHFWRIVRHDLSIRSAIASALDDGVTSFVEVGGQPTLRTFIEAEAAIRRIPVSLYATMERDRPMNSTMDSTFTALDQSRRAA